MIHGLALSAPPRRWIGSELMLMRMLERLQRRGHDINVTVTTEHDPFEWNGFRFTQKLPASVDVLVYQVGLGSLTAPARWRVGVAHNARSEAQRDIWQHRPNVLVANSDCMRATISADMTVHPPVDLPKSWAPGDCVTVVNLDLNKAASFWKIARSMADVEFIAVTGGYGRQIPESLPNVEVVPHLRHERMRELVWDRTAVLLVPSKHESWSMTATEAMAHGIPVVASDLMGLRENVGAAGVLLPRENVAQWVSAIRRILSAHVDWSAKARARAELHAASWESEVEAWADRVEQLEV